MTLVGLNYTTAEGGQRHYTLHVTDDFNSYYSNSEAGRGSIGKKADTIYTGDYDCSHLKVGMDIDIMYDKAVKTSNGVYQPVKKIDIISSGKKSQQ